MRTLPSSAALCTQLASFFSRSGLATSRYGLSAVGHSPTTTPESVGEALDTRAVAEPTRLQPATPLYLLLPTISAVLAIFVRLSFGPSIRDDAYITLRYARNLAEGNGFVFNLGERVLGTTTPLFTILVAALARLGIEPTTAAIALGILADTATVIVLFLLVRPALGSAVAWTASLIYALLGPVVTHAVSGMETPLYTLLIVSTFAALGRAWWRLAALLAVLAVWLRPDGLILWVVVLAFALYHRHRPLLGSLGLATLLIVPWTVYAWRTYGSPLPHSVIAKIDLPVDDPFFSVTSFLSYFADNELRSFLPLSVLFLLGCLIALRQPRLQPLYLWALLYTGAFMVTNKFVFPLFPFEWYFVPLLAPYAIGIAAVLARRNYLWVGIFIAAYLVVYGNALVEQQADIRKNIDGREALYMQIANRLDAYGVEHDVVAVPEIGALGYAYHGPILDLEALVSPQVLGRTTTEVIETERPPWLVSYHTRLPDDLLQADWFQREYRPVLSLTNWESRYLHLYRRYAPIPFAASRELVLGDRFQLDEYRVHLQHRRDGSAIIHIELSWTALVDGDRPYKFYVHLLDPSGHRLTQQDNEPQENTSRTNEWRTGEQRVDKYDLTVPAGVLAGNETLVLGGYETDNVNRGLSWKHRSGEEIGHWLQLR